MLMKLAYLIHKPEHKPDNYLSESSKYLRSLSNRMPRHPFLNDEEAEKHIKEFNNNDYADACLKDIKHIEEKLGTLCAECGKKFSNQLGSGLRAGERVANDPEYAQRWHQMQIDMYNQNR